MSYSCCMKDADFRIDAVNFEGTLRKLIASDYCADVSQYRTHQTANEMLAVCDKGDFGEIQWLLEQFFHDNGYAVGYDGESNIVSITHVKDHWHEDANFFKVFAEFVEKGSYIEMSGEDDLLWRMYFDGKRCQEINAVITWPGIDDEVTEEVSLDEAELLSKVGNAELGRVYDDIDDMFAYMFNEVDSFNDFVSMLTPELKEAIVFAQEWNGGVVKANGQYYYSSDFDGNFMNVAKSAVVDKYKIAKEVDLEDFKNALECLGYSPDDYTEEELREMSDDHFDKLGNDDVYNAIYNETLEEVVKAHEKVASVEKLVEDAVQSCADMNKDNASKSDVEFEKE